MFIYNLKLNKKTISKLFVVLSITIIILILIYSIYIIFFKNAVESTDNVRQNDIIELDEANYTDILKASNENIDSYVGKKVRITGYVYRLLDFNKNQFVIARDMKFNNGSQSLVVGFLSEYKKASDFPDGAWVEIVGKIKKGNFNGEIAMLDIVSIKETSRPKTILVDPPHKTYIPTSYIY